MKVTLFPQNKKTRRDVLLAVVSGVLLGLSFPPFHFYLLAFVALIPLFFLFDRRNGLAEINRITYLFAFVFNLITLYWVGSWSKDADPFLMISGTVLLFFNPLLFLIPSSLFYLAKKKLSGNIAFLLLPFFWVSYEFLYSVTDFRFPWLTLGNSQPYFNSFIQIADVIGVYGLTLIIIYINYFLFETVHNFKNDRKSADRYFTVAILFFIIPIFYSFNSGKYDKTDGKPVTVGLVQPNLNPWKKWDAGNLHEQINLYFSLSQKAIEKGAKLILFPESALPVYLTAPSYWRELRRFHQFVDTNNVYLLTGMPDINFYDSLDAPPDAKRIKNSDRYYTTYNAAYFFSPHKNGIQEYHKEKLVPFGEKIPLVEEFPFLEKFFRWNVGISSWNVGEGPVNFTLSDSLKIGTLICIESIYPEYASEFVRKGANILAVITNDSWYGKTSGPYQHAAYSILRAVENRRWVIRDANGGISCVISPTGKVTAKTNLFTQTVLVADIYPEREKTFYTAHPYLIPGISLGISLLMIIFSFFNKRGKTHSHSNK